MVAVAVSVTMRMVVSVVMAMAREGFRLAPHHPEETGAGEARDKRADQRQEYDRLIHERRLALHKIDVLNRDRTAVAEIDNENGQSDRGLARGHGQDEQGEDLPDKVGKLN